MNSTVKTKVSPCHSFHITTENIRLYDKTFDHVLPFHITSQNKPLAPVTLNGKSWHILISGEDAYSERYDKTFGFYCDRSAVINNGLWFHITPTGEPCYNERYVFVGNFQQNYCVVCDEGNNYFHIDTLGQPIYKEKWRYCGDFREGSAVVQSTEGISTHILENGALLHNQWFLDLDVFHKGYARAQDSTGWHHINSNGKEIYPDRYANVEPFYNGCSRVEGFDGSLLIIDEQGQQLRTLREPNNSLFSELSADMVGYWKTFTIAAMVELGINDLLPCTTEKLAIESGTEQKKLLRLMNGLAELGIAALDKNTWFLTKKGQYLKTNHQLSLSSAAIEYKNDLLQRWYDLPELIKGKEPPQEIFEAVCNSPIRVNDHHKMLRSYALHDYKNIIEHLDINSEELIFDAAGGSGALCSLIKDKHPEATVILGDMPNVIKEVSSNNFDALGFDLFSQWPVQADKIILSRILHDWNDNQAIEILKHAKSALKEGGSILILEMLLQESDYSGSLCDLHLLAATGGQERNQAQFKLLAEQSGLQLLEIERTASFTTVIRMVPQNV